MLLRNLDQKNGHCNGVKYVILNMLRDHVLDQWFKSWGKVVYSKNNFDIKFRTIAIHHEKKTSFQ